MGWVETGLPWVPPSPNLPTPHNTVTYAATVFLEATTACEGRGTTTPFELFGAPWYRNGSLGLASRLNSLCVPTGGGGALFRAAAFTPTWFKYNGTVVGGVQWARLASQSSPPASPPRVFGCGMAILAEMRRAGGKGFEFDGKWFNQPGSGLVDKYAGTPRLREAIEQGRTGVQVAALFEKEASVFAAETRTPFLLY